MVEMMKKVKAIPIGDVCGFLSKNKYNEVECSEYNLGSGYVETSTSAIGDYFSGKIIGRKKTLINAETSPVLDEDTISFDVKKGVIDEVKLSKYRIDSANGYSYLENHIDKKNSVHKTKIVLNSEKDMISLSAESIYASGVITNDELTFEDNGVIRIKMDSVGNDKFSNFRTEVCFDNGTFKPIETPDVIVNLEQTHIGIYILLKHLKDGKCGFDLNEKQKQIVEDSLDTFLRVTPFHVDGSAR